MPDIRIQLIDEDDVEAAQAAAKPTKHVLITVAVITGAIAVGAVGLWNMALRREAFVLLSAWFGMVVGARIGQILYVPRQARRVFKQQRGLQLPCTVSWSSEGLTMVSQDGTATTSWRDFHKAIEIKSQFVLFLSEVLFVMIPKRAFPSDAVLDDFRAHVVGSVSDHRGVSV